MKKSCRSFLAIVFSMAVLISFLSVEPSNAAQDSMGTEFFLLFQTNHTGASNLDLFITSDINTSGVVEVPGASISIPFTVTAGNVTTVSLPVSLNFLGNDTVLSNKGIHVVADDEVTVYGLNQRTATTDAFLGLPVDILNRDYLVLSHSGGFSHNKSQFAIVAAYDGTVVTITPSVTAAGHVAGVPYTVNLNRLDTYQLQAPFGSADLSGTEVHANNPIAVFAGNQCDNLPGTPYGACDHNVEQLFPEASWGTAFLSVPLATRTNGDTFRIIASVDNTTVDINGTTFILNRGDVDDRILTTSSVISADESIMVAQYSNSSTYDGVTSDPFMMLLPPFEQFLTSYIFSTPASGMSINYVNVVVPNSATGDVVLDGSPVPAASFSPIGASGYSGAALSLSVGSHNISCSEPIGISSYGFDSYDSYGYPGGLALEFIDPKGDAHPPIVTGSFADCEFSGTAEDSRPSEDINDNGVLDPGEDLNGNSQIDEDTGIFLVELNAGSTNLVIAVDPFIPGAPGPINYTVSLIDSNLVGSGEVIVTDGAGNTDSIQVNIDCREMICEAPPVECTEENPCDILDPDDTCPGGANINEDVVEVEPDQSVFCGGDEIIVTHSRLGSFLETRSSTEDVCGGDCQTACVDNCVEIPLQKCYKKCVYRCSNGLCLRWETTCDVIGLQTVCDERCFTECEGSFDGETAYFNRQCGHEITDLVEVRQVNGSSCTGPLMSSQSLAGVGTAGINLSAPLQIGSYEICVNNQLRKSFTVNDCGSACSINIVQNQFQVERGQNASMSFELENINGGGTYTLSLQRFEDDEHTIAMSIPSFISLPSSASLPDNGAASLSVAANNAQPDGEQNHWANIIIRAEGPTSCEAVFDLDVTPICGDLDRDGDVDGADRNMLRGAFRTCTGDGGFIAEADYDGDGCITFNDYREWYKCYRAFMTP